MLLMSAARVEGVVPVAFAESNCTPPTRMLLTVVDEAEGKAAAVNAALPLDTVTTGVTPAAVAGPLIVITLPADLAL